MSKKKLLITEMFNKAKEETGKKTKKYNEDNRENKFH